MSLIAADLEVTCRRIVRKMKIRSSEPIPTTFIAREMALILDCIDTVRERQRALGAGFVNKELYIDTQVMNLEEYTERIPSWLERTKIKNELNRMLERAEWHAQRLVIESESALQQLQKRLLELWNMHDQLSLEHGDRKDTA